MKATIELTVRSGWYGEKAQTFVVPLDERAWRDIANPVELSDEPLSLLLASPGMMGGRGDAVTIRESTFKLRRSYAQSIADALTRQLLEAFGVNDELDGHKVSGMSDEERAWHQQRGRLAPQRHEPLPPSPLQSMSEVIERHVSESLHAPRKSSKRKA